MWVLPNIWRLGLVRYTKFGLDVSNKILLNAAKCRVTAFTVSELLRENTHPPRLGLRCVTFGSMPCIECTLIITKTFRILWSSKFQLLYFFFWVIIYTNNPMKRSFHWKLCWSCFFFCTKRASKFFHNIILVTTIGWIKKERKQNWISLYDDIYTFAGVFKK